MLYLGSASVDSGMIWIGDPCYVISADSVLWNEFVKTEDDVSEPLGRGLGIAVQTPYGDGDYPVFGEYDKHGNLASVTIMLNQE